MNYVVWRMVAILLPTVIIGGLEYFRHDFLEGYLSMEAGNFYMTLVTFILSYLFSTWMFRHIERTNFRLVEEQARRAVYEERERLANELHDNIAQTLFFLNVKLQKGHIEDAKSAVSDINNQVRQAIFNLRVSEDEGIVFMDRVKQWLSEWSLITGVVILDRFKFEANYFTSVEEVQLFGLIQEAFTNIRKHSQADQARIEIRAEGLHWLLRITDNGCGLSSEMEAQNKYGIMMMKKRSEELGAQFEVSNLVDGGLELIVTGVKEEQLK
jgi:signal transduction histidine kinase